MKYSVCVAPRTVETVDGMDNWIEFFAVRYRARVNDFDLKFDGENLEEPIKCIIHLEGPVLSFLKLWLEYRQMATVFIGW